MFSRIVIASEMSPAAFSMLHCLERMKGLGVKECLLVQCLDPHDLDAKISSFYTAIIEENLSQQKALLEKMGYTVNTRVATGYIKNEINRIAVEEDYSMMVVGAPEHSMVGEVFFGGTAHEVILHAQKPVLLIRIVNEPEARLKLIKDCNLIEHILFPTDFSDNAKKAFEVVKKMVVDGVKRVTLIHVIDKAVVDTYLKESLEDFKMLDNTRLQAMKVELQTMGNVEVDVQLPIGSPSGEIIRMAKDKNVSLLVMGSQGRGFLNEVFLGSVSHQVARHSSASILLIPANRE
ncbi:universal stress protein [Acetobacterium fimetarium]|nr:universal stress protein [Acetobacterium fimetarium]